MTVCPSSSCPPQQWHLASPSGPDLLPVPSAMCCHFLAHSSLLHLWHTTLPLRLSPHSPTLVLSPELIPSGTKVSEPSPCPSVSGCGVQMVVQMIYVALTLLCPPRSSCYAFLHDFEVALACLISLSVSWLPRMWVPFLFHSSLSGMLVLIPFLSLSFFFCSTQLCQEFLALELPSWCSD